MAELIDAFTWETCGRGDGKFDAKKFLAVNHEHMKQEHLQSAQTYAERAKPFLLARGLTLPASDDVLIATANGIALQVCVDPDGPSAEEQAAQLASLFLAAGAVVEGSGR
jgi:hypothetical protein